MVQSNAPLLAERKGRRPWNFGRQGLCRRARGATSLSIFLAHLSGCSVFSPCGRDLPVVVSVVVQGGAVAAGSAGGAGGAGGDKGDSQAYCAAFVSVKKDDVRERVPCDVQGEDCLCSAYSLGAGTYVLSAHLGGEVQSQSVRLEELDRCRIETAELVFFDESER